MQTLLFKHWLWRYLLRHLPRPLPSRALEDIVGICTSPFPLTMPVGGITPGPLPWSTTAERLAVNRSTGPVFLPSMSKARIEWWEVHLHSGRRGSSLRAL